MAHADQRLRERTSLPPSELARVRRALRKSKLSPGAHHYRFRDGSMAVLKPIRKGHVVATVLSRNMRPPGENMTHLLGNTAHPLSKAASGWAVLPSR